MSAAITSTPGRRLDDTMSVLQTREAPSELRFPYDKRLMLVSGRANPELAARISDKLGVELGSVTLKTFANGEVYCRYEESVRGADVFIVQPTCGNLDAGLTANDALMELLFMIDAAVGGSAHRVIAVTPWYGYSRQDKKSAPREPISARLVARMLESAGIDRILTMDLHSGQIQGFFQKPCDHMTALFMLTQYFADKGLEDLVVVSPDTGRVKLNNKFAQELGADLAILNKERPAQQVAEINYVIGDVAGKTAVLVDDIIGTAGTLRAAAEAVHRRRRPPRLRRRHARQLLRQRVGEPRRGQVRAGRRDRHDPPPTRRPRQRPRALVRRPADQLNPPDLHRRVGQRGLRRREPALLVVGLTREGQLGLSALSPYRQGPIERDEDEPDDAYAEPDQEHDVFDRVGGAGLGCLRRWSSEWMASSGGKVANCGDGSWPEVCARDQRS